ncbi:MAG: outer membrane lipid asymmetry maintenance protein MlaD, partial [Desulfovibrio sp.]|nr:outer membrane lipid asymmetry maintenance protein MlaD [Desulfovibrio sp.]
VRLLLDKDLHLSDDSIASIKTSGLIGDKYVSLSRGGSEKNLASGGVITETESPVDLESLIGKYAFGGV